MFVVKTGDLADCGAQSYPTLRDAREAAQKQRGNRQPYRCSRCSPRVWHLDGFQVRDARHKYRVVA